MESGAKTNNHTYLHILVARHQHVKGENESHPRRKQSFVWHLPISHSAGTTADVPISGVGSKHYVTWHLPMSHSAGITADVPISGVGSKHYVTWHLPMSHSAGITADDPISDVGQNITSPGF